MGIRIKNINWTSIGIEGYSVSWLRMPTEYSQSYQDLYIII